MSSFVCQDCDRSLLSKQALNHHVYRFHSKEITVELNKVSKMVIRNDKGVFVCPYCNEKYYPNPDSLKRHVKKTHDNNEKGDSNSDDDSLVADDAINVALNTQTTSSQPKDQTKNENNIKRHDYKISVLSAFDVLHQQKETTPSPLYLTLIQDTKM